MAPLYSTSDSNRPLRPSQRPRLIARLVGFSGSLLVLAGLWVTSPDNVLAKCPDVPDAVCSDLRFSFQPDPPVAGEAATVVARWFDERTNRPVANRTWLSERGAPVYLWVWDHQPSPDEWQNHSVLSGNVAGPQTWVSLHWDGASYNGQLRLPREGWWYFEINTSAPVTGQPSDPRIGYSGMVYSREVGSSVSGLHSLGTRLSTNWLWLALTSALGVLGGLALRRLNNLRRAAGDSPSSQATAPGVSQGRESA